MGGTDSSPPGRSPRGRPLCKDQNHGFSSFPLAWKMHLNIARRSDTLFEVFTKTLNTA